MRRKPKGRRLAWSLVAWWSLLALVLWLLGRAFDHPASLLQCTASAAVLAAVGELGDWLRRRRRTNRTGHRRQDS
ncbi:hypothetical protein PV392_23395 [Streptomyces sp. ME03-5709C]|nr:hypothetical protein [Streptomyces sp. ME03-5709C]